MKSRIAALFMGLALSLAAHATSIDNPVAPLDYETSLKFMAFDDQVANGLMSAKGVNPLEKRVDVYVGAVDIPYKELGYSLDKTFLALLKINDTDPAKANKLQRMGYYETIMPLMGIMRGDKFRKMMVQQGYLSQETVNYWINR